jgi:predicted acyltransferase
MKTKPEKKTAISEQSALSELDKVSTPRLEAIDIFRGLAILGMVLANYLAGVEWISPWFKHAKDVGYTVIDLVAPMFIFAVGLTYGLSFKSRIKRDGAGKTYQHFIVRFFALLGMGALFSAGEILLKVDNMTVNWGVLQAIGAAGLVTLIFMRASPLSRLIAGIFILSLYQFLLDNFWLSTVLSNPHGGLLGSISWAGMMILGTVLADFFFANEKGLRNLTIVSFIIVLGSLLLSLWLPISKNRVSVPYVLLSLGLSGLLFCACQILVDKFGFKSGLLALWGRNPLVMYLLHLILLGLVFLPGIPAIYAQAPIWLVIVEAVVLLGGLTLVAWKMDKEKIYFSL